METQTKIGTGAAAGIALVSLLEPHLFAWSEAVTVLIYLLLASLMIWGFMPIVMGVATRLRGTLVGMWGPSVLIVGGPILGLIWLYWNNLQAAAPTAPHAQSEHPSRASDSEKPKRNPTAALMPLVRDAVILPSIPIDMVRGTLAPDYGTAFEINGHGFFAVILRIDLSGMGELKEEYRIIDLLSGVLPYVIFTVFDTIQSDGKVMSATDGTAGKTRPAVLPPEWILYPNEDLRRAIRSDRYAKIAHDNARWSKGGEMKVPKGTVLKFYRNIKNNSVIENIEFASTGKYILTISIEAGGRSTSGNPPTSMTFSPTIRLHFEFIRTPETDQFQQVEYEKWASELFAAFHRMIDD